MRIIWHHLLPIKGTWACVIFLFLVVIQLTHADSGKLKEWKGDDRPSLEFYQLDGEKKIIEEFMGSVTVVNFWATWCAPCINEIPSLIQLSDYLKDQPFRLVMINFGESPDRVKSFAESFPKTQSIYSDEIKFSNDFWVTTGLPTTYILDKKNVIRYVAIGELNWSSRDVKNIIKNMMQ